MSAIAKDLLQIMTVRLKMQEAGITSPSQSVRDATKQLVAKLEAVAPDEEIEVAIINNDPLYAKYIRTKTGQVLAEIHG
ncbi:hypothetical protein HC024_21035 [Methylococcaceae bacterium WWC4]|nr:hypothetical protein [Methylococcaceae bacterium WWC4]